MTGQIQLLFNQSCLNKSSVRGILINRMVSDCSIDPGLNECREFYQQYQLKWPKLKVDQQEKRNHQPRIKWQNWFQLYLFYRNWLYSKEMREGWKVKSTDGGKLRVVYWDLAFGFCALKQEKRRITSDNLGGFLNRSAWFSDRCRCNLPPKNV